MDTMILNIALYICCCAAVILLCVCERSQDGTKLLYREKKEISVRIILLIAAIFTLFAYFCVMSGTTIAERSQGDLYNYYVEFSGKRKTSTGLTLVFDFVKLFSKKFESVLWLTVFICCVVLFAAYGMTEDRSCIALVLLLLTSTIFTMFINLKQCYANVFSVFAIALAMKEHKWYKDVISCFLIFLALQFHAVAMIAFPIFLLVRFNKWQQKVFVFFCLLLILAFVFLKPLALSVAEFIRPFYPYGSGKILEYFGSTTSHVNEGSIFSFIKGAPFYLITVVGFAKRKVLKTGNKNYDTYLFLSLIVSLVYLSTVYSYWLSRAVSLLYFYVAIFFGILYKMLKGKERMYFSLSVIGMQAVVFFRWFILTYVNYGGF